MVLYTYQILVFKMFCYKHFKVKLNPYNFVLGHIMLFNDKKKNQKITLAEIKNMEKC